MERVTIERDFESWRSAARSLLARNVEPGDIFWTDAGAADALFAASQPPADEEPSQSPPLQLSVPRPFLDAARLVACHRSENRWFLLYRILWRIVHGGRSLLEITVDDDVHQ